ncbi:MAG: ABC transporter permease [Gemmatimonadales bacterium]|nr:MAG: ABC transporter permease [Gemmatimonadales bacterium]
MPFELFVALRYLRDGRLQTALILTGIAVGVGVIIFLSALITGLQEGLIQKTLGSQPLVVVRPPEETPRALPTSPEGVLESFVIERPPERVRSILDWQATAEAVRGMDGVTAVAPTISGSGIAARGSGFLSLTLRGIEPPSYNTVVDLESRIIQGHLDLEGFQAVVGTRLSALLGVPLGGRIRLQTSGDRGGVYTISGIFDYGSTDLNERLVFVSLRSAQTLFDLPGGVSSLEVRGNDIFDADALAHRIADRTGMDTESWIARNEDLLVGLRSQTLSSVMIQTFVILAVALGIASVLSVSVVQRARDIGILRATGTRAGTVTRVFLLQGAILGTIGSLFGIALGTLLALLFAGLARGADGTALFPISLTAPLYLRSVGIALGVGLLAAVLPARNAAQMDPAKVIRDG